ncbi:biotin carboxyl carrier protein of acetyl-CoA carboxylase [bacterium MnTg02]|nr:biotin carboxyl carrier protein of acetyl-CoA carboxylase [bacterium MnTg02]
MSDKNSPLDKDLIRELADLLHETDLTEIEIERKGLRLRVARNVTVTTMAAGPGSTHAARDVSPLDPAEKDVAAHPGTVTSPMVGTVYRAAEPGAQPFVEIGVRIEKGEPLLIVEAMKTMNQISAPKAGTVTAILVEDGQPVEFGEPLIIIE